MGKLSHKSNKWTVDVIMRMDNNYKTDLIEIEKCYFLLQEVIFMPPKYFYVGTYIFLRKQKIATYLRTH